MKRNMAVLSSLFVLMFAAGMQVAWADPALDQCRAQNSRVHADTMQLLQRAMAAGRITPQERQQLAQIEQRLRQIAQNLARGGLTLAECRAMTQQLVNDLNVVRQAMARITATTAAGPGPVGQDITQCRNQNTQIYNETTQLIRHAMAAGRITPQERQQLAQMEQRLRQAQILSLRVLTLNECRAITQQIVNERAVVARMVVRW